MKAVLVFIIFFKYCQADFCQYNFSISDLHNSVAQEIKSVINNKIFCATTTVTTSNINFWLYTRSYSIKTPFDSNIAVLFKKTIVLIPGWLCNVTNDLMPELKNAYLTRYDANVIIVDWSYYAAKTYGDAFCRAPQIAKTIAKFLIKLDKAFKIYIESLHIVGHSMGAQIAGLIGQELKTNYNKRLYRITGLDPAGPLYFDQDANKRLDKSDASFVDVIHTNGGILGYYSRCGHVDYYPGCGTFQNGCSFNLHNKLSIDFVFQKFGCDHLRAVDYMIESVKFGKFTSYACPTCPFRCTRDTTHSTSLMGEDSINNWEDGSYILFTNPKPPFAGG